MDNNDQKKVLVAEDDKYLAGAYSIKLQKEGFDVKIAYDGEEVFTILQTFTPDVILLDLVMPVKDGFTTLKELKQNDLYKNIPVVITSNLSQKDDIDKGMSLGATDYITKSDYSLKQIIEKILKYCG